MIMLVRTLLPAGALALASMLGGCQTPSGPMASGVGEEPQRQVAATAATPRQNTWQRYATRRAGVQQSVPNLPTAATVTVRSAPSVAAPAVAAPTVSAPTVSAPVAPPPAPPPTPAPPPAWGG